MLTDQDPRCHLAKDLNSFNALSTAKRKDCKGVRTSVVYHLEFFNKTRASQSSNQRLMQLKIDEELQYFTNNGKIISENSTSELLAPLSSELTARLYELGITSLIRMTTSPLQADKILLRLANLGDIQDASSLHPLDLAHLTQHVLLEQLVITLKQQALLSDMVNEYLNNEKEEAIDNSDLDFNFQITEMSLSAMIPLSEVKESKREFKWIQEGEGDKEGNMEQKDIIGEIEDFIDKQEKNTGFQEIVLQPQQIRVFEIVYMLK